MNAAGPANETKRTSIIRHKKLNVDFDPEKLQSILLIRDITSRQTNVFIKKSYQVFTTSIMPSLDMHKSV